VGFASTQQLIMAADKSVIILGGDGFVGWPASLHLSTKGYNVHIVDNLWRRSVDQELETNSISDIKPIEERIAAWKEVTGRTIEFHKIDVSEDFMALRDLFDRVRPEAVVHCAEQRAAPYSMKTLAHRSFTMRHNTMATHNVLMAILDVDPEIHMVHIGTMGVYGYGSGDPNDQIPEGYLEVTMPATGETREIVHPYHPGSIYHMTKCLDNVMMHFYAKNDQLKLTDLHQGIVWGAATDDTILDARLVNRLDQDGDFGTVLNRFCIQSALDLPVTPYGTGGQTRAFIHIRDSVECIATAIANPPKRGDRVSVFNQCTETIRVIELARQLEAEFGATVTFVANPRNEAESNELHVRHERFDSMGCCTRGLNKERLTELMDLIKDNKVRLVAPSVPPSSFWNYEKAKVCGAKNPCAENKTEIAA